MARIRSFKPELLRHPVIGRLPEFDFKVVVSSISAADDEGYFRADAHIFRGDVMPFQDDLQRITESLQRLSEIGWIEVREHPEQGKVAKIVTWEDHQKISHPSKSKIKTYFNSVATPESLRKAPEILRSEQGAGSRERNREQGSEKPSAPVQPLTDHEIEDGVTRILKLYPVIVGKDRTEKAILQAIQAEEADLGSEAGAIAYLEAVTAKYARTVEPFRNDRRLWEQVPRPWNWFGEGYYKSEDTWIPVGAFDEDKKRPRDVPITQPSTATWDEMDDATKAALADVAWRQGDKKLDRVPEHMRPYVKAAGGAA